MATLRWVARAFTLAASTGLCLSAGAAPAEAGDRSGEDARVELGRRLFFDPAVSRTGNNSCASCHDPEHGFSDPREVSEDDFLKTKRHAQGLLDLADLHLLHWDGQLGSIEELVTLRLAQSWIQPVETGYGAKPAEAQEPTRVTYKDDDGVVRVVDVTRITPVSERVEKDGRYASALQTCFGSTSVTTARIAEAIAAFVRSIRHTESAYDRFAAGDRDALSPEAKRGLELFRGKAGCVQCHKMDGSPAPFTDRLFHDTGIEWKAGILGRQVRSGDEVSASTRLVSQKLGMPGSDDGRKKFSTAPTDARAFKTPTLRDVARRGPYMHNGMFATLEQVVRNYAKGSAPDPNLDARIKRFDATDSEVAALVEFLQSLSGDVRPATAPDCRFRVGRTRIRFLDARGRPLAGLQVGIVPAGDPLPGDSPRTTSAADVVSDAEGWIEYAPPRRSNVRLALPDGLRAPQGEMVPDTCARLTLTLPVRGRATVSVLFPVGIAAPKRIAADNPPSRERLADITTADLPWTRAASRVMFTLEAEAAVEGKALARYAAFIPNEAPKTVSVEVPGANGKTSHEVSLKDGADTRIDLTTTR